MRGPFANEIRRAFEADYEPASRDYRARLREAVGDGERPPAHWSLALAATAVAVLVVGTLVLASHLPRQAAYRAAPAGATPVHAASPGALTSAPLFSTNDVGSVRPLSASAAWAVRGSDLFRTTDAGAHWRRVTPPDAAGQAYAISVQAASIDEAWMVAGVSGESGLSGLAFHTTDGGATWSRSARLKGMPGTPFFVDGKRGWILTNEGAAAGSQGAAVYRTDDAGGTWSLVNETHSDAQAPSGSLGFGCQKTRISFVDENHGWVTGSCAGATAVFYATQDGGNTFFLTKLPSPQAGAPLSGQALVDGPVFFSDSDGVLAAVDYQYGAIFYTTHDAGRTWMLMVAMPKVSRPAVLSMSDWVVVTASGLRVTHDGGHSWKDLAPPFDVTRTTLVMINSTEGWAIEESSALFRTEDGGRTWARVPLPQT